ncbi:Predicted permease YjgP/YjgQ family [Campylobacter coli 76339]|nr:Predicted permease YjgP/YjgQ family [Campylobacter coli 76339]
MKLALRYVLNQFLSTNLSIFFVLFTIVSMVFFIQLAKLTSSIEINFFRFAQIIWFYAT